MITILGTGHIFNIAEPVMFIIKQIWPDAVLVELDPRRFQAIDDAASRPHQEAEAQAAAEKKKLPWIYRSAAKYQQDMAKDYGSSVGNEMLTAVNVGKLIGAEIGFIDIDAEKTMNELWAEMPFGEKLRYRFSVLGDRFHAKKKAETTAKDFSVNEDKMIADMRRKYPTLVRKLIDERNVHMAEEVRKYTEKRSNIVIVVGDAHVEGIAKLLDGVGEIRKIRLNDMMDEAKYSKLCSELWNREAPKK
jgi:pheromone shutdown protein TraB